MAAPSHTLRRRPPAAVAAAVSAWAVACVAGLAALGVYRATPGAAAPAGDWPTLSELTRAPGCDTLVVAVHPRCPCSRATIANLAAVLDRVAADRVRVVVLFVRPPGVPVGWERAELWASAAALPGAAVVADDGGREAALFGAATSGQAELFDPAGHLLFRGGLTAGRGHGGDCAGTDAVIALVAGRRPGADVTPVFGCPLADPAASTSKGPQTCRP